MKYLFELPIGDFLEQGHRKSKNFLIESNKDVMECRELYFATKERLRIGLDEHVDGLWDTAPCSKLKEMSLTIGHIKKLGLNPINYKRWIETGEVRPDDFAFLFIDYMTTHNPELKLRVVNKSITPKFIFYGEDNYGRRIGNMGYGLFEEDLLISLNQLTDNDKNKRK